MPCATILLEFEFPASFPLMWNQNKQSLNWAEEDESAKFKFSLDCGARLLEPVGFKQS